MPQKSKSASWHETNQKLLQSLVKKSKTGKSALLIFSSSGDLAFQAGKMTKADPTSIGALVTAARSIAAELDQLTKMKTSRIQFGDSRKGYWLENFADWIIVGVGLEPQKKAYEAFKKHLKKRSTGSSQTSSEALDGLSVAAVETAVEG